MTRFLIGLALLVTSVSAVSKPTLSTPGMMLPVPIRYEFIFELAKITCPKMMNIRDADMAEFVSGIAQKFQLTAGETTTLLNHCLLYLEGVQAA